jgi:ligand-binding SRPBCC domain-containing protein
MGLTYSSVVDADRDEVFSWHARPGAIARLTPPWQPVTVLGEAGSLRDGRAILGLPGGLRCVAAAAAAAAAGLRTVQVRTGIVQTPRGGMLRLLSPLFAAGLGALWHLFGRDGA